MTFNAKRRAIELELLAVRLREIAAEAPHPFRPMFELIESSVLEIAKLLKRYDQTGPDCEIDDKPRGV